MRRSSSGLARCLLFPFHADKWGGTAPDTVVALEQPIHGGVEVLGGGVGEVETVGEGGRVPPAGGGVLGMRPQDAGGDHGADEVAGGGIWEATKGTRPSWRKGWRTAKTEQWSRQRTMAKASDGSMGVRPAR